MDVMGLLGGVSGGAGGLSANDDMGSDDIRVGGLDQGGIHFAPKKDNTIVLVALIAVVGLIALKAKRRN